MNKFLKNRMLQASVPPQYLVDMRSKFKPTASVLNMFKTAYIHIGIMQMGEEPKGPSPTVAPPLSYTKKSDHKGSTTCNYIYLRRWIRMLITWYNCIVICKYIFN